MRSCLKIAATAVISSLLAHLARGEQRLVAHQWSTFTVLQDESGKAIGGINLDDIPIAEALHKIAPGSLLPVGAGGETVEEGTRCHADVTMRLEKAVMNFYAAKTESALVELRSYDGLFTQYFPAAKVRSPGFTRDHIGTIGLGNMGTLEWSLALHPSPESRLDEAGPQAARIDADGEEADSLICRGVSGDRAPFRVVRDGPALNINETHLDISRLWLVELRADGTTSLRVLRPFNEETAFVIKTPARFAAEESSPASLDALDAEMAAALQQTGLYAEEIEALLLTLHQAHWQRMGMRIFFVSAGTRTSSRLRVRDENRRWLDVPGLAVSVGCVEIVTPEQRRILATIAAGGEERSLTGRSPDPEALSEERWEELREMYEWLGQFRNALLLDEQRRRSSTILAAFIERFHLEGYAPRWDWVHNKPTR